MNSAAIYPLICLLQALRKLRTVNLNGTHSNPASSLISRGITLSRWRAPNVISTKVLIYGQHLCSSTAVQPPGSLLLTYTRLSTPFSMEMPHERHIAFSTKVHYHQHHLSGWRVHMSCAFVTPIRFFTSKWPIQNLRRRSTTYRTSSSIRLGSVFGQTLCPEIGHGSRQ